MPWSLPFSTWNKFDWHWAPLAIVAKPRKRDVLTGFERTLVTYCLRRLWIRNCQKQVPSRFYQNSKTHRIGSVAFHYSHLFRAVRGFKCCFFHGQNIRLLHKHDVPNLGNFSVLVMHKNQLIRFFFFQKCTPLFSNKNTKKMQRTSEKFLDDKLQIFSFFSFQEQYPLRSSDRHKRRSKRSGRLREYPSSDYYSDAESIRHNGGGERAQAQ